MPGTVSCEGSQNAIPDYEPMPVLRSYVVDSSPTVGRSSVGDRPRFSRGGVCGR